MLIILVVAGQIVEIGLLELAWLWRLVVGRLLGLGASFLVPCLRCCARFSGITRQTHEAFAIRN
jgi:hypothetical protein